MNNAQKEAFKRIIEDTDASDHKNVDGTTSDDIDDALANAANTDNAMARLEELEKKANALKTTDKYTGNSVAPTKKAAFDKVLQSVDDLLNKDKGDAKGAPEVNDLYTDLLNKMRDLDTDAQSAGLKTDALAAEIKSDKTYKPSEIDSTKNPGNSVYNTSSQAKKDAFDAALIAAEQALQTAKTADVSTADKEAAEQKKVDEALDKLIKARLALDGVDTTDLQKEIDKESATTSSDAYKYDSQEKQNNYNKALQDANDLIDKLTGTKKAAQGEEDVTTKTQAEKQKLVDEALAKLKAAEEALKGNKPVEPTPTPTPFEKVYKVSYEFKSNTSDKELPQEVKKLLPQEEKYYSIQKVKPKDVTPKEVKVGNDTWTFKGFDKNEIMLKDGENKFIGSWECKTKQVPTPDPVPTPNPGLDEDEDENNNNDKKQNDKEQKLPQTNIAGNSLLTLALSAIAVVFSKKKRK